MKVLIFCLIFFAVAESFSISDFTKGFKSKVPRINLVNEGKHDEKNQVYKNEGFSPFIVGGTVSPPHDLAFEVALYIDDEFFCGGALINELYVLTAAHCTYKAFKIETQLGAFNRSAGECCQVFLNSTGSQIITHSLFNNITLENDIALVRLPRPVTFSNEIKPVVLPNSTDEDLGSGVVVKVAGWGLTSDDPNATTSDVIQEALVGTISNAECILHYGSEQVKDYTLCTSSVGGKGICYGDSGAALLYDSGSGPVHRGIVSFIPPSGCLSEDPNGFTRTTHYLDWIQQNAVP